MTIIDIMLGMTLVFVLYICAYNSAKKSFRVHILFAVVAFLIDIWLTLKMMNRIEGTMSFVEMGFILQIHILLSSVAIFCFLVQAGLGILTIKNISRKKIHTYGAKAFMVVWTLSFGTGIILFFL